MKYRLRTFSILEVGQRKDSLGNPHQEDSIFPSYGNETDNDRTFIVCDGMGGHDAGEIASATVCKAMSAHITKHNKEGYFSSVDFQSALEAAFDALDEKDTGAQKKMGTTLAFLQIHEKGALMAHIGDSRVYHIRPGRTVYETKILYESSDHSLINELVKAGEITREEARTSRQKNIITRALQPHMDPRPEADIYETSDIRKGDFFFLCSDGMLEVPSMEDGVLLREVFSDAGGEIKNKVRTLSQLTKANKDNHSAIIVNVMEVEESKGFLSRISDFFLNTRLRNK